MEALTTIFYVDDDADDLNFFKEATIAVGTSVALFDLADDMLDVMRNPPPSPSIVFLDLNMHSKSGYELLDEIKHDRSFVKLPVVVMSTASDRISVERCRKLGANYYVCKPNSLVGLIKAIDYVIHIDWDKFSPDRRNFMYRPANRVLA